MGGLRGKKASFSEKFPVGVLGIRGRVFRCGFMFRGLKNDKQRIRVQKAYMCKAARQLPNLPMLLAPAYSLISKVKALAVRQQTPDKPSVTIPSWLRDQNKF